MIFRRYFLKWFFLYSVSIAFLLGFLLNLIEFFEKLMRTSGTSLGTIVTFLTLRLLPSFFELLPVGSWLGMCLIIKDFIIEHEWETIQILGINRKSLVHIVFTAGLLLAIVALVTKEFFITPLSFKAEQFKAEKFKNVQRNFITNKWVCLNSSMIYHIGSLDVAQNHGWDLTAIYLSDDFSIEKIVTAPTFKLFPESESIGFEKAILNHTHTNEQKVIPQELLHVPQLFSLLKMDHASPSIINLSKNLIDTKKTIPWPLFNKLLFQLFKKITFFLQLLWYPLLTLIFFLLLENHKIYRWIGLLLPYPIILFSDALFDFLVGTGAAASFIFAPYVILFAAIFIIQKVSIK